MSSGGWYPDPEAGPGRMRWWDGSGWSEHTVPAGSPESTRPPEPAAPPSRWQRIRRREEPPAPDLQPRDWRNRPGGPGWQGTVITERTETEPVTESEPRDPWYRHPAVPLGIALIVLVGLIAGVAALPDGTAGRNEVLPTDVPSATAPPLAQLCEDTAPSKADPNAPRPPAPAGPRITDTKAKISYAQQGAPFRLWDQGTWGSDSGSLGEEFTTGQYFITQQVTPSGGPYMTTILSGTVPAAYGDDPHPNIECAARVIAEDVSVAYYPSPNQRSDVAARAMTVSGRPAYYLEFHLAFDVPGYDAKGEQVAICVIDVQGSKAAVLYVSVPDTHKQFRSILPKLMSSIRVLK